jgi:hypothetical protein
MTFWSSPALEPTRKYRFKIQFGNDIIWWAKSVTKPSFEVTTNKYTAINHSLEYPGIINWNDITLTVVDVGKKTEEYYNQLKEIGYNDPIFGSTAGGINKIESSSLKVFQMDAGGKTIETWTLHNYIIKSIQFGDLSYDDDGLVEMQLAIGYDFAEFDGISFNN